MMSRIGEIECIFKDELVVQKQSGTYEKVAKDVKMYSFQIISENIHKYL